jgi:hypothetical protein
VKNCWACSVAPSLTCGRDVTGCLYLRDRSHFLYAVFYFLHHISTRSATSRLYYTHQRTPPPCRYSVSGCHLLKRSLRLGKYAQASQRSAHTHTSCSRARNREQSPLLRLPGELRNKIYEYAMSDVTITIFPSSNPRKPFQLYAYLARGAADAISSSNVLDMTGLMRTCQQVYLETRLLPFQAITFHVNSDGSFITFLEKLLGAERDAITTVQLSTVDANMGGNLYISVAASRRNDEESQRIHLDFLEWSWNLGLDRLVGLKRVVVEPSTQWYYGSEGERFLRAGISRCIKGRDVPVVLPEHSKAK